jgi:transposase
MVPKNLSVRVHRCDCGLVLDRDVNAARNILRRSLTPGPGSGLVMDVELSTSTSSIVDGASRCVETSCPN